MSSETIGEKKTYHAIGTTNYYIAIAIDVVLLYVLNNVQYFGISIITKDYISVLWAINLALSLGIVGNFILLLYRPRWFHHLTQVVLDALALFAVYIVFKIFPFGFGNDIFLTGARIILVIIMAGIFIGVIAELVRFAVALIRKEPPSQPPVSPVTPESSSSVLPPPSPPAPPDPPSE